MCFCVSVCVCVCVCDHHTLGPDSNVSTCACVCDRVFVRVIVYVCIRINVGNLVFEYTCMSVCFHTGGLG